MSDQATVTLTGAWAAFTAAMDPHKFEARLRQYVGMANERIGRQFVARARRKITEKAYTPNSPITVILKRGKSTPLVDKGDLNQAISYDLPDPWTVRVGVVKRKVTAEVWNIALILHEGAVVDVAKHPGVRRKVWAMVAESLGNRKGMNKAQRRSMTDAAGAVASGGGPRKDLWIIPPRPYIQEPLEEASFAVFARKTWEAAVLAALTGKPPPPGGP